MLRGERNVTGTLQLVGGELRGHLVDKEHRDDVAGAQDSAHEFTFTGHRAQ
jgi:hypothetical protein